MNRHLYNNDELDQFGPFNGNAVYSAQTTVIKANDIFQVVSGSATAPKRYYYHGAYKFTQETTSDKPPRKKYLITPITPLNPPMEIKREMLPEGDNYRSFIGSQITSLSRVPENYMNLYKSLIDASGQYSDSLEIDIGKICNPTISSSKISTAREVLCRVGQGQFKKNVISIWGLDRCALTGISLPELLIASHIKAWAKCEEGEHLNGCNGLLLASHIDKLFDKHLITFREHSSRFMIETNPKIDDLLRNTLAVKQRELTLGQITPSNFRKVAEFLKHHNSEFDKRRG